MHKLKVTVNTDGYVTNFAIVGDLENSTSVTVTDFNHTHFDCYKLVDGTLICDDAKYQNKINPNEPQLSELELLKQQLQQMQTEKNALAETLDMILTDVLPALMP